MIDTALAEYYLFKKPIPNKRVVVLHCHKEKI